MALRLGRSRKNNTKLATPEEVLELYRELLGREPENADAVAESVGKPLLKLAIQFAKSEEYRAKVRPASSDDVRDLYLKLLNRVPESAVAIDERVGRPIIEVAVELAISEEFMRLRILQSASGVGSQLVSNDGDRA